MQRYEAPSIQVILYSDEDIVSTSAGLGTSILDEQEVGWTFD